MTTTTEHGRTRVILVGIGGATCSGKTTLAKHLNRILPNSVIIHQDDFAPPIELIPIHPVHGVQDWDSAPGAIDWARFAAFLRHVKSAGVIPPDHRSHDHLNVQKYTSVDRDVLDKWTATFKKVEEESQRNGEKLVWGLVDGFLLYWNRDVIDQLDVRIFLRVPHDVLHRRRHERDGYYTAVQSDPEGSFWRDPPRYWEEIVYPAYVHAHRDFFENGDVEHGKRVKDGGVDKLVLLEGLEMGMDGLVMKCCETLLLAATP